MLKDAERPRNQEHGRLCSLNVEAPDGAFPLPEFWPQKPQPAPWESADVEEGLWACCSLVSEVGRGAPLPTVGRLSPACRTLARRACNANSV